jgi:CBS domain-containing protein
MYVSTILKTKGSDVAWVRPDENLVAACCLLKERDVGALVVSADGMRPLGVMSERDVARALAAHSDRLADKTVGDLMSDRVITCGPDETIDSVMATMTRYRVRHLPVMQDGALAGIISIGDVVKFRLDEMAHEAEALKEYIANG